MTKQLYIVGTPIGNLGDISKRMIDTLTLVDIIYAEDTRSTLKLLSFLGIKKSIRSSHKDNEYGNVDNIFTEIASGKSIAIVSDAGMPTISDPGNIIIKKAIELSVAFEVIPSPTALISALVMSGLSGRDFYFYGFLPHDKAKKISELKRLKNIESAIILYESPHRIIETIKFILDIFNKKIAVCREITKLHESLYFVETIADIDSITIRGEFTLVIDNKAGFETQPIVTDKATIDISDVTKQLINDGLSSVDILKVLKAFGVKRNEAYRLIESFK